ncbi:MAG: O-antigen ligase family protein [Bacteroidota bacterium]
MQSVAKEPFVFSRVLLLGFESAKTKRGLFGVLLLVGASVLLSAVIVLSGGNVLAGAAFLALLIVVFVTLYRVDWGLYLLVFLVFFFDQFAPPGYPALGYEVGYFRNLNAIQYLPTIKEGVVTPMELQLFLIFFVWVLTAALRKDVQLIPVPLKFTAVTFFLAVTGAVVYGQARGGDFVAALWEVRGLFYLGILFFFVPQVIQTQKQIQTLIWVCIAGISFKAFQGAWRFAANGFSFGWWPNIVETYTNHEDPVFFITLFMLLSALSLFGGEPRQRRALTLLLIPLVLGYIAAQRRATYISLLVTLAAFIVLMPKKERWITMKVAGAFLLIFVVYLGVFWNSNSKLGLVAVQFKSTITDEGGVRGEKDLLSKLYRDGENYDLATTFRSEPFIGIGFGKAYEMVVRLWGADAMKLGSYVPHNQILWIFVKMGIIGGFLFWFFFNSFVFRTAMIFSKLTQPYLKVVCIICVISVVGQLVVSYVDMQLNWTRNMVHLGLLMGLVPTIEHLDKTTHQEGEGGIKPLETNDSSSSHA